MNKYEIKFTNGDKLTFTTDCKINFHVIATDRICFDDMLINLREVLYIREIKEGEV